MKKVYVDPQSYSNLAKYDSGVLSNFDENTTFFSSSLFDVNINKKVKVKKIFKYNNLKNSFLKFISYEFSLLYVLFFCLLNRVDILHFQWLKVPKLDIVFLKLIKFFLPKLKLVLTVHNVTPHNKKANSENLKCQYSYFDILVVHEKSAKDELIDIGVNESKISIIKHGLIPFTNDGTVDIFLRQLLKKSVLNFVLLGNISHYKGVDIVIDAWNKSDIKNNKNYNLILAGKSDNTLKLNFDSDNIVNFNRYMSESELNLICNSNVVIVFPYRKISQSGVLLSVIPYKLPLLVNPIGGLKEPFDIFDFGWMVKSNTIRSYQEFFDNAISNESEFLNNIKMINEAKEWDELISEHSWTTISCELLKLYNKLN